MDKTNEPDADELAQRIQNRAAGRITKEPQGSPKTGHRESPGH